MVTTPKDAVAEPAPAGLPEAPARPVAHLNARISGYLADSVILLAFVLVFFVAAGAVLLFTSDLGQDDPPDSAYNAFIAIIIGGTLVSWTVFNVALMRWRGQTAGMYVVGIRTVGEVTSKLTTGQALVRWFGLHPLLFHPILLPIWILLSLLVVSQTLGEIVLIVTLALALLCLISPVASLISVLVDPARRALHDRLARTLVVHMEHP
jgi:uncharacterized RDD family membrane protein YckC